jgi:thioredoxin reductase
MNDSIAIIGAGPAGLTAAIQLQRYGIRPFIFEKKSIGGLLQNANKIENYLGFPNGISGKELTELFRQQFANYNCEIHQEKVQLLDYHENQFEITTDKSKYFAKKVLCASGTLPQYPDLVKQITPEMQQKIFYEIISLLEYRDKTFAIIGAGDAAFDYALNLARHNKVYVLNRSKEIKALPFLQDMIKANSTITYWDKIEVARLHFDNNELQLELTTKPPLEVDYLIYAIGRVANTEYFSDNICKLSEQLQKEHKLFVIGDVKNGKYRQASIAAADGIKAAMQIALN